jgi:Zn finger protein HypA/HybF involved in hydrogenase expression
LWELTPSVFIKSTLEGRPTGSIPSNPVAFFKCPECGNSPLKNEDQILLCPSCGRNWNIVDDIFDFRGDETL